MGNTKVIPTYEELCKILSEQRKGRRVVCTIGSWDILHRGHIEYLEKAMQLGDILVVGVDSDVAYQRNKKRPPMFPQEERLLILSSVRYVDYITLIHDVDKDGEWQMELVKAIEPDVFLCNYQSFPKEQREKLAKLCPTEVVNFFSPSSPSVVTTERMKQIVLRESEMKLTMRSVAFFLLVILLSLSILTTLSIVLLTAFRIASLPEAALMLLIGKTIPEVLGMWYLVVKYLFPVGVREQSQSEA
jgi:cytidyltransferase-like protein